PAVLLTPVDDPERAGGHAVAAAVADVGLDDHGAELGPEQRPGRADLQARGRAAVLAHVRAHQPAQPVLAPLLLDEGDVAPGAGPQGPGVVVGVAGEAQRPVLGGQVPLLAGALPGLAADADRGVGEEPDPRPGLAVVAAPERRGREVSLHGRPPPARPGPRNRRP